MIRNQARPIVHPWSLSETVFAIWVGLALAILTPATLFLQGSFPLFTVVWLVVPLLAVIRSRDSSSAGFTRISWGMFLSTTAINLGALLIVTLIVEPWSHAYQA